MNNQSEYFNSKYHVSTNQTNAHGLFTFLYFLKTSSHTKRPHSRPPYPVLCANPSITDIVLNFNKGDFMTYLVLMSTSFFVSNFSLRSVSNLRLKLVIHHCNMHIVNVMGILLMLLCSESRFKGLMDNGLRWKTDDLDIKKYDFTSEYKKISLFGFFHQD